MFSLPYSLAFMGLISQLSNGNMGMLRLPSPFSFPSISLGTDTTYGISIILNACPGGNTHPKDPEFSGWVIP